MDLLVPVSAGELLDKIAILRIKAERIRDGAKLANVHHELEALGAVADTIPRLPGLDALVADLRRVNEALWEVEDDIRAHESREDFGPSFVRLARLVYTTNDERARLKRRVNDLTGSLLVEEKSYGDDP